MYHGPLRQESVIQEASFLIPQVNLFLAEECASYFCKKHRSLVSCLKGYIVTVFFGSVDKVFAFRLSAWFPAVPAVIDALWLLFRERDQVHVERDRHAPVKNLQSAPSQDIAMKHVHVPNPHTLEPKQAEHQHKCRKSPTCELLAENVSVKDVVGLLSRIIHRY